MLGVNNQGQISGIQFQISPSAPGIVTDGNGNVNPTPTAQAGSIGVLYVTGDGVVTPALKDGFSPASGTPLPSLPHSLLPFSVTVGGVRCFPGIRRCHARSGGSDPGELHGAGFWSRQECSLWWLR